MPQWSYGTFAILSRSFHADGRVRWKRQYELAAQKADPIFQLAAADIGAPVPELAVES